VRFGDTGHLATVNERSLLTTPDPEAMLK
jgi:hypothetical protein